MASFLHIQRVKIPLLAPSTSFSSSSMESTAYPAYHPTPYKQGNTPCCCRRTVVCRLIIAMAFLVAIILIVSLVMWLVFRHHFPHVSIVSASVSGFNVTALSVSGKWDISFDVRNPNKRMTVSYEDVQTSVYYKWTKLSETDLAPFRQGTGAETKVPTTLAAAGTYVYPAIINDLKAESVRGSVNFTVEFDALVTVRAGAWWKQRTKYLNMFCDKVPFAFPKNSKVGTFAGGSIECHSI